MKKTKRTKIVCTLGPATHSARMITRLVKAGMNVARLNFSHGDHADHAKLISIIRAVEKKTGEPVAIMQDLQGPKIRVGILPKDGVALKQKSPVVFDTAIRTYSGSAIPVDFSSLHSFVKKGERLLLDDGRIETLVAGVKGTKITATVQNSGALFSHKGINIPDSHLEISALTDKDKQDAHFGVEHGVDIVALSFVTGEKDIFDLRYLIKAYEKELGKEPDSPIRIIAKIERGLAVKNIEEILDAADGIMIARGDLGIEIRAADVPLKQKEFIDRALAHAKPVIVATQMLDSMRENPRPTRAEVSDVANAVIDHADALMLSNETAAGSYPAEAVATMADIIIDTEKSAYDDLRMKKAEKKHGSVDDVVSRMSRMLAEETEARLILAASLSGETGRLISRHRPELPIVVATGTPRVRRQLNLSWGVVPFVLIPCASIEELVERSLAHLKKNRMVRRGEKVIVVAGEPVGESGHVNVLEVREVK